MPNKVLKKKKTKKKQTNNNGVRKPAGDDKGVFGKVYKGAQSVWKVTLVLGSASVALGQDSPLKILSLSYSKFYIQN